MASMADPLGPFQFENLDPTATRYLAITAVAILVSLIYKFSSPPMDSREPPLLKAKIPIVGHIVGLVRHGIDYLEVLRYASPLEHAYARWLLTRFLKRVSHQHVSVAAGTLPVFNQKSYVLFDRALITAAMRHKNLTFEVLSLEFAQRVFGISDQTVKKLWVPDHGIEKSAVGITMHRVKAAMQGQNLYRMNTTALSYVAERLNEAGQDGLRIPNLYQWLRKFMTMATSEGIYGSHNPLRKDPSLVDALWYNAFHSPPRKKKPLFLGSLRRYLL